MRRVLLLLLVLLAGVSRTRAEDADTVEAALAWESGTVGGYRVMVVPFRPDPPAGLEPLEGLVDARYARIRWGTGRGLSLALDAAPGHDRIWIDTNLDGRLDDEQRDAWSTSGTSWLREESVLVSYPGEVEPETVPVRFMRLADAEPEDVRIFPQVHRRGEVVLAGRLRVVALVDRNADLRFDDAAVDRLYVDVDGNGAFTTTTDSHELITPGTPFRVGDEGWQADVLSASGRSVRFTRLRETPAAAPRTWRPTGMPTAGGTQTPPAESFDELRERLEAEKALPYAQRYATVQLIGRVGTDEARRVLVRLVGEDDDNGIKAAAVRALNNAAYMPEAGRYVAGLTRHSVVGVAQAAVQTLHGLDYPDREAIYLDLAEGAQSTVAGQAVLHLAYLGTPRALAAVRKAAETSGIDYVRYQAYMGLRTQPEGPGEALMLAAAGDDYVSLRSLGLRDLHAMGHPRTRAFALEAAAVRPVNVSIGQTVIDILGAIGDAESVEALLEMAAETPPTLTTRFVQQLATVRDGGAIAVLVKGLRNRSPAVRILAAQVLAGIGETKVTDALVARLRREKDESVQIALLEALGDHRDARTVDVLLKQARRRRESIRLAAIRALGRIGFDTPAVRRFFVSLLDARGWEERVLAIDAAAASADVGLCGKIANSLDHDVWQVRLAAVDALGRLRCPASVEALIARLEDEEQLRIRSALAATLYRITGMNLYDHTASWQKWWDEHGADFEMPESVPDLPAADVGGTRAGFYGIPVESGRVIFVIDQSGSMSAEDTRNVTTGSQGGNRLDVAIREVIGAVKQLKNRDRVNVILFHTTIHPWRQKLQRLTGNNRGALTRHLEGQKPTGGTNLYDALEMALLDPDVDTIFMLSDGAPGLGKFVATEDILRAVARLNQTKRTAIHCVSIGLDSALLKRLAAENGGQYVRR
ncbi:MAG: HEAT repeat domain-containing protein [Planctomycetota bacterium]|jgi:HEAT repeat protein